MRLDPDLGSLVLAIRNKEACKCDGWLPDLRLWCYGLTSARNERSAGKPLLQHCRSIGLWWDQGKLLPWASTYWQSVRVSPWEDIWWKVFAGWGGCFWRSSHYLCSYPCFVWSMKEGSWFVSQMAIWHVSTSHGSLWAFQLQLWNCRRVSRQLCECFTQFHMCSKIEWLPLLVL